MHVYEEVARALCPNLDSKQVKCFMFYAAAIVRWLYIIWTSHMQIGNHFQNVLSELIRAKVVNGWTGLRCQLSFLCDFTFMLASCVYTEWISNVFVFQLFHQITSDEHSDLYAANRGQHTIECVVVCSVGNVITWMFM